MNGARDHRFMALALALGRRGLGRCWPNPAVGCVIVQGGRIVGRGWTQPGGRPHAETVALAQAGGAARGATAYVSLEPCAHHGATPPCADALIAAGVARVVAPLQDDDPRVSGQGFARLRAAGVEVTTGLCADAAARDHAGFFLRTRARRPFVTLKLAMTLDGRIATASGESRWITGTASRADVHAERARHDAVMVGGGTARADDPSLTVRGLGMAHQPVRVVLTRRLDLPLSGKLAQGAKEVPLWLLHDAALDADRLAPWQDLGAETLACATEGQQIDITDALGQLADRGLTRLYCEGGGALAASLLAADCVDALDVYSAGLVLGAEGWPAMGALGLARLDEAPRLALRETRQLGPDLLHRWERVAGG